MHSIKVNHSTNLSIVFYLKTLLDKPIEIQFNRIGDDITKRNNELTGSQSVGFRYKKFIYNGGYQSVLHPSLHEEAKAMQEWLEQMQKYINDVQPLLHALASEDIGKQTINYFIPDAVKHIIEVPDTIYKKQVETLEKEFPTEIMALNLLKIGALLV